MALSPSQVNHRCTRCERELPAADFYWHKTGRLAGRIFTNCKTCELSRRTENRGTVDPLDNKKYLLKRKYGLTWDAYLSLHEAQGNRCAVCGTDEPVAGRWTVDHDHETGAVRGILCTTCNTGLGHFKDSPDLLVKAIEYLARSC